MAQQVQWGKIILSLDRDLFRHAYRMGREHHFETCQEEPSQARTMTVEQVMGLVAVPNAHGEYEFDDAPTKAEEIVGFVLGYMGGPWISETPEECCEREHRYEITNETSSVAVL